MENWDIIVKYLNNEATASEKQELEAWLKEDIENAALYEEIKLSWEKTWQILPDDDFDAVSAWNLVQEKIKLEDNVIPITGRNSNFKWVLRIAAVLTIAIFSTWYLINDKPATTIYASTADTARTITLPDGSTVWLNKNSMISYPEKFDTDERMITLEGEAFFDVVKDPTQPFIVYNNDYKVKVLGTSFNVLAYANSKQVVVTVETGTVTLSSLIEPVLTLTKGEVGTIDRSTNYHLTESLNTDPNFMAWKTRKLRFNNESIRSVCDALKNYFTIDVIVEDKTIYNCKFTGSFEDAKLQDVLKTMEAALNIKVKTNQNRVTISGKGCE